MQDEGLHDQVWAAIMAVRDEIDKLASMVEPQTRASRQAARHKGPYRMEPYWD